MTTMTSKTIDSLQLQHKYLDKYSLQHGWNEIISEKRILHIPFLRVSIINLIYQKKVLNNSIKSIKNVLLTRTQNYDEKKKKIEIKSKFR